jgi:hypothetical protein
VSLAFHVQDRLEKAGYSYNKSIPPAANFALAIESLSAANDGKGVVILIDEYDAPVGHTLDNIEVAEAVRARLSALYSQMKNRTGDIRFMLMTGVSKFTKLSVFSALNNIVDISQEDGYATMFGYTEEELSENFEEHLRNTGSKKSHCMFCVCICIKNPLGRTRCTGGSSGDHTAHFRLGSQQEFPGMFRQHLRRCKREGFQVPEMVQFVWQVYIKSTLCIQPAKQFIEPGQLQSL